MEDWFFFKVIFDELNWEINVRIQCCLIIFVKLNVQLKINYKMQKIQKDYLNVLFFLLNEFKKYFFCLKNKKQEKKTSDLLTFIFHDFKFISLFF